jgi:hypothetical protein
MESWFAKLLSEPTRSGLARPDGHPSEQDLEVAAQAFSGAPVSDIRTAHPGLSVKDVANAVRRVVTRMRLGQLPGDFTDKFPQIAAEQLAFRQAENLRTLGPSEPKPMVHAGLVKRLLKRVGDVIDPTAPTPRKDNYRKAIEEQRRKVAPALGPMVLIGLAEGIAAGDREMVKLGAEYLEMLPEKKRGPGNAVQINFGESQKRLAQRGIYFEGLLRKVASKEEPASLPEGADDAETVG